MKKINKNYNVQVFRTEEFDELVHIFNFWKNGLNIEFHTITYTNCGEYHEMCIIYSFKEDN